MEFKVIFYIIIGIIYLVTKVLKKKKPEQGNWPKVDWEDTPGKATDSSTALPKTRVPSKPASFEDLLREISNEFAEKKEPKPTTIVEEKPESFIEEIKHPHNGGEAFEHELTHEEKYVLRREHETLEHAQQKPPVPTNAKDRLENYEEELVEPPEVLSLLQEEGGVANAIILSEILNRKY